jgi:hypothetical protein
MNQFCGNCYLNIPVGKGALRYIFDICYQGGGSGEFTLVDCYSFSFPVDFMRDQQGFGAGRK